MYVPTTESSFGIQGDSMTRLFHVTLGMLVFSLSMVSQGRAAERLALVIGNSAYRNVPELPNPTRDSSDVADALERMQFKVTRLQNASAAELKNAVIELGNSADS